MRRLNALNAAVVIAVAMSLPMAASAGMPRGAQLMADEQDADPATGVTTARGNAEIRIDAYRILGRADRIDVDPGRNEILFHGHALITVGDARYESERVTCSLDFEKCAETTTAASTALPDAGTTQTRPVESSAAATINP